MYNSFVFDRYDFHYDTNASYIDNLGKMLCEREFVSPRDLQTNIFRYVESVARINEAEEYLEKLGISLPLGYVSNWDIGGGMDVLEEKNFFQNMQNLYEDRLPFEEWTNLIKGTSIFGIAYYNAMLNASNGGWESLQIPSAKEIFAELKKLLQRMSYAGIAIDDEVREKYM